MSSGKRALLFSPYLDTLGGGEVYIFKVAQCLKNAGYNLVFAWKDLAIFPDVNKMLGMDFDPVEIDTKAYVYLTTSSISFAKLMYLRGYQLIFAVSDGSIPLLPAHKNILHFQVPFNKFEGRLINQLKLFNTTVVCNSIFTKKFVDKGLGINSKVVYPPLISRAKPGKKSNIIVSVGRFTSTLQNKRQDLLIDAFKDLVNSGVKGWQLVLVGNTRQKESHQYLQILRQKAKGYPIIFLLDASLFELEKTYEQAKIYWHASGMDIDENTNPERVEHFGLVTVEAMQAGCVPVVVNKGGQKEIVLHGENGYLFNTIEELVSLTGQLIREPHKLEVLSQQAQSSIDKFSNKRFCNDIGMLL